MWEYVAVAPVVASVVVAAVVVVSVSPQHALISGLLLTSSLWSLSSFLASFVCRRRRCQRGMGQGAWAAGGGVVPVNGNNICEDAAAAAAGKRRNASIIIIIIS